MKFFYSEMNTGFHSAINARSRHRAFFFVDYVYNKKDHDDEREILKEKREHLHRHSANFNRTFSPRITAQNFAEFLG